MKCFYHKSDLDGHCSGAIVKMKYPECEMFGVDYIDDLVGVSLKEGETIFVVDFSFSPGGMDVLIIECNLIWIDHHKSAIKKMEDFTPGHSIQGLRSVGKAGCELTWMYLYPNDPVPEVVTLLGRYDVWDHESNQDVLPFQYGIREQKNTLPHSEIWSILFKDISRIHIADICDKGVIIQKYQAAQDEKYAKGMSYEVEFEGLRALVMNKPYSNSKVFDSIYDPERHDIMILFGVKPGEFKYTLYTDKTEIDVSELAVKYGGGGHRGAAGFYSKEMVV